jgi:hypothetical protein
MRTATEGVLLGSAGALALFLLGEDEPTWAALAGGLGVAAALAGLAFAWQRGELRLAWRCPRLDRLGVKPLTRAAPWSVLCAAEAALVSLGGDVRRFEDFFETARLDIAKAARRAVQLQSLKLRADRALLHAPEGEARQALVQQTRLASEEQRSLEALLAELRARFVASTAPLPTVADPLPALKALEQRSGALGAALDELRGGHR